MNNLIGMIAAIIYVVMIFVSSKVFEKSGKEVSRKYIHIMLSNWWIIAMIFFDNWIWASIMPACFIVINYLSYKYNIIKVMERDEEDDNKNSLGTIYYAISLFVLAVLSFGILKKPEVGLCGTLVMGYGDGLAAVIGKGIKSKKFKILGNQKSVAGCITMFIVTFTIIMIYLCYCSSSFALLKALLLGLVMTAVEACSVKGLDNITVPIITSLIMCFLV